MHTPHTPTGTAPDRLAPTPDTLAALAVAVTSSTALDAAARMLYALTRPTPSVAWPAWDALPEAERVPLRRDAAAILAAALEVTR